MFVEGCVGGWVDVSVVCTLPALPYTVLLLSINQSYAVLAGPNISLGSVTFTWGMPIGII